MRLCPVLFVLVLAAACGAAPVSVPMRAESNSGQTGTATLTEEGANVRVSIDIAVGADTGAQPVHIHTGQCGQIGDVKSEWPLADINGGKSVSVIQAKLSDLTGYAINAHNSKDLNIYVSCGNIP